MWLQSHETDSENNSTAAPGSRKLDGWPFLVLAVRSETCGHAFVFMFHMVLTVATDYLLILRLAVGLLMYHTVSCEVRTESLSDVCVCVCVCVYIYIFVCITYVFGPKRDGVTGEWRKLHNEELNDLYSSPNIVRLIKSRRKRWAGHVARMEEGRGVHKVSVGKPEGKRPLGRPRCRWEDNIKMDLQEVRMGCGDWMELGQDRDRWRALVSTVMNFGVP